MLSRVAECTARTLTDIRIYAEKAAFEGQALRSMINGMQTRTKHKLSDITKSFAERCYEERLFFYFSATLRICINDENGDAKAREILQELSNDEEATLRDIWEPLLDHCSDVLRKTSMDASSIRLSKLSDLWKRRACSKWLISLVSNLVQSLIGLDDEKAAHYSSLISRAIQLPWEAQYIAQGEIPEDDKHTYRERQNAAIVVEDIDAAMNYLYDFVTSIVQHSGESIRIVCRKEEREAVHIMLANLHLQCDSSCDICSNVQSNRPYIFVSILDNFDPSTVTENKIVIFWELEDLYFPQITVDISLNEHPILQCIAEMHIRGSMILQQMNEIEGIHHNLTSYEIIANYHRTWPKPLQNDIPLESLYNVISTRNIGTFFLRSRLQEYARLRMIGRAGMLLPASLKTDRNTSTALVNSFLKARQMKIGVDYRVIAVQETSGPILRVELCGESNDYGLQQFIELRHGCQLTATHQRSIHSLIKACESSIIILRTDRFGVPKNIFEPLIPSSKESPKERRERQGIVNAPHSVIPPKASDLIVEKQDLHKQKIKLERTAQMVHILRETIGKKEDSFQDLRCDGFVEQMRTHIEEIMLKLASIDEKLSNINPYRWPYPNIHILTKIARENGVDGEKLAGVAKHFDQKQITFDELMNEIEKTLKPRNQNVDNWISLLNSKMITALPLYYALSPDTICEATHFLHDLRLVELPKNEHLIQFSDRYLADCSFYEPISKHFDDRGLLSLVGASREYFASFNANCKKGRSTSEKVVIGSTHGGKPIFLCPSRVGERIARELVRNGLVNCSDASSVESRTLSYETLVLPCIYDPASTAERVINTTTWLQGSLLEYGSFEWINWLSSRLIVASFSAPELSYYSRSISEREFCLRDELLIHRIQIALTSPGLDPMLTNLNQITMDAFVNTIVEKITRGERLVDIRPPFRDKKTADKLARFIRSRRIPPTEY